jgi:phage internal scaffolding protein
MPVIRKAYDEENGHYEVGISFDPAEKRTKEAFAEESNINNIVDKYLKTGIMTHVSQYKENYGEATSQDFKAAMDLVTRTQQMFDDLPSELRNKFNGNPSDFLDYVQNPNNKDEITRLGLTTTPEELNPQYFDKDGNPSTRYEPKGEPEAPQEPQ